MKQDWKSNSYRSLFVLAIGSILGTVCISGTLPPAGLETSQFFYLVVASIFPTIVNLLRCIMRSHSGMSFNMGDLLVLLSVIYLLLNGRLIGEPTAIAWWEIALLFTLYVNVRLFIAFEGRWGITVLIALILLLGMVQIVVGIKQLYGFSGSNHTLFNLTGSFHNPAPLGGFLALISGVALYRVIASYRDVLTRLQHSRLRSLMQFRTLLFLLSALGLTGALILLPATMSRIAWLGGITATGVCLLCSGYGKKAMNRIKEHKKWVPGMVVIGLVVVGFLGWQFYHLKKDSADGRLLMWKIATQVALEHPITGTGSGLFAGSYGDMQAAYFASGKGTQQEMQVAGSAGGAFNDYLQCLAEYGIIGLLCLLAVLWFTCKGYLNPECGYGGGLFFALLALLVFAFASYPLEMISFRMLFLILIAVGMSCGSFHKTWNVGRWGLAGISVIMLGFNGLAAVKTLPLKQRYQAWKQDRMLYQMQQFESALADYTLVYPDLEEETAFVFEYANALSKTERYDQSLIHLETLKRRTSDPMIYMLIGNNLKALGRWQEAEAAYWRAYRVIPSRIYPLYLLTQLYRDTKNTERMVQMGERVLAFEEKVPSQAVREIKANVRKWLNVRIKTKI